MKKISMLFIAIMLFVACNTIGIASQCVAAPGISVEFVDADGKIFAEETRAVINEIAGKTWIEVRHLLPQLPEKILITVSAGSGVIPETGETGTALEPGHISWVVDTSRSEGTIRIARSHLRSTLFHEMNHLARGWVVKRDKPVTSFMDVVISEGMATVFEREFAGSKPLWGEYPDDVKDWVDELLALDISAFQSYQKWMFIHPDGRRYIGYRAGTYIVDQAIARSGLSSADLVSTPAEEVLRLAGLK